MAEWNSAPYFPIDLKGLAALFALAPDADIRERARRAILRLLEIVALSSHQGMLTASQGRSYEHSLRPCRTLGAFRHRAARLRPRLVRPPLPRAAAACALRPRPRAARRPAPDGARRLARRRGAVSGAFARARTASPRSTTTRPATMRWARSPAIGRASGAIRRPCCICASATGRKRRSGSTIRASGSSPASRDRPIWGGCGTLPRVHQYRDLAVLDFVLQPEQVDFTHAWLPEAEMDEVRYDGRPRLVRAGRALALLLGSAPFERVDGRPDGRLRDPACRHAVALDRAPVGCRPRRQPRCLRRALRRTLHASRRRWRRDLA